ncbi:substrate-binding domain-containing protein [Aeromicrobium fastidiosum]|uniref:substrate-binding domain-containing protein n=1 Tax=Aeromicrobium fastidiosum TaxID=52699 RepID=UPI002023801D|nr:substrate-binding domain-containing protein [Aeromicrobium fastidiosum]MCL8251391.1 substrate-binding domain-containing protein [Aeromicrobium fastidiosum]
MSTIPSRRRGLAVAGAFAAATLVLGACTNSSSDGDDTSAAVTKSGTDNDKSGDKVVIGFSAPAADHGWMGAITKAAVAQAEQYDDVELKVAEGTNDVNLQISQVETFINDKVDAIVLLPFDGAAMTQVARKAMDAGITVVNVDREFDSPFAARTTVLGDNYGMGVSAGTFVCEDAKGSKDKVVAEIAGIDSLPLTQERSQGFEDALKACGLDVDNRVAAEFTVESGEKVASNLLQAAPKIDYLWNHDDDQGVGVLAAINNANRDEFTMIGGAGSADVMEAIKAGDSVLKATVVYPSTQAADGVKLARLLVQDKSLSDLAEIEVPRQLKLAAPVVTADNVDTYLPSAFRS